MAPSSSITVWLARLKAGDRDAAAERLWSAYFERMVRLAQRHLGSRRLPADGEDVALSAFDSFVASVEAGRFPRLDDRDDLWQVLFVLTSRKVADQLEAAGRLKRGGGTVAESFSDDGFASPEPDPAEAALLAEEVEVRLTALADPVLRQVAVWKLEGYANGEIAAKMDRSVPTVERRLRRIRARLARMSLGGSGRWIVSILSIVSGGRLILEGGRVHFEFRGRLPARRPSLGSMTAGRMMPCRTSRSRVGARSSTTSNVGRTPRNKSRFVNRPPSALALIYRSTRRAYTTVSLASQSAADPPGVRPASAGGRTLARPYPQFPALPVASVR
jgi:DNA-directed RNA polymerase specialized sigma24 family protein